MSFLPVVAAATATPIYVGGQNCEPIGVQGFQYQAKAEPLLPIAPSSETVTQDKWERRQSQPLFRVQRSAEFIAYVTANSSLMAPERIDLDKWIVRVDEPRRDLKREQWKYRPFSAESLHTIPSTSTPVYISGQSCEPISVSSFQYPSITKPVITPAVALEDVTADKWQASWPQPYLKLRRLIQYGVNCAIAEQADDGLPPVHWIPQANIPQQKPAALRDYWLWSKSTITPAVAETITLDKWGQPTQRPTDKKRSQWIFPNTVRDLISRAESVSLDKFQQPQSEPRRDVARKQYLSPVSASDYLSAIPGAEVIRLDKWNRQYADLIFRPRGLPDYGRFAIDPTLTVERVSIDKWAQPASRPRLDLKRNQWIYPAFSADTQLYVQPGVEIVRADKWGQPQSQPTHGLRGTASQSSEALHFAESIIFDKWFQPVSIPRRDFTRLQHLYPTLTIDAAFYLVPSGTDYLAYDRHFGIIVLRTTETGTLALLTAETGGIELLINISGTLTILTEVVGDLD